MQPVLLEVKDIVLLGLPLFFGFVVFGMVLARVIPNLLIRKYNGNLITKDIFEEFRRGLDEKLNSITKCQEKILEQLSYKISKDECRDTRKFITNLFKEKMNE